MGKNMTKKHYLVTGITGFAAPHLARLLLKEGHKVSGLIRGSNGRQMDLLDILFSNEIDSINWIYGDLKNGMTIKKIFENNRFDGVFHLAAQSHPPTSFDYPLDTFENNIIGTAWLVEAIRETQKNCSFMFCSTSEVYGDSCKEVGDLKEDMPLMPNNPYGVSKASSDLYIQERCKNGFLKGFITRAFSHTGPRRGKNFSVSCDAYNLALIKKGIKKEKVLSVGNLKTKRIVTDVRDMVRAYYLLMQNYQNGQAYNVCGPAENIREMGFYTDKLIEISGLKVRKRVDPKFYRPIDIKIQTADTTKLKKAINWKPEISIDKTLKDLFNYWMKKL